MCVKKIDWIFHFKQQNKYNAAIEIIETIRLVAEEFPPLETALKNILADYDTSSYEKMKCFCDRYNKVIKGSVQMVSNMMMMMMMIH